MLSRSLFLRFARFASSQTNTSHYDIVIAGGGLVGTTFALALASEPRLSGYKTLLLDSQKQVKYGAAPRPIPKTNIGFNASDYSNRVVALSPATIDYLYKLGAWQRMDESRLGYFKRMYVWDACSDASISFESADASMVQYLAASVENDRVMQALFDALDHSLRPTPNGTNSGAVNQTPLQLDRAYGVQIAKYVFPWTRFAESGQPFDDSGALPPVELELSDGRKLTTSLLIGSDGHHSAVRRAAQMETLEWTHSMTAIVGTVHLSEAVPNETGWQRFLPDGTIAFLPLRDNLSSLVWCTSSERARELMKIPTTEFTEQLNHALFTSEYQSYVTNSALVWSRLLASQVSSAASAARNVLFEVLESLQAARVPFARECKEGVQSVLGQGGADRPVRPTWPVGGHRFLPPTAVQLDPESRFAIGPLAFMHATQYVKPRVALIGDAAHRLLPLAGLGVNLGIGDARTLAACLLEGAQRGEPVGALAGMGGGEGALAAYEARRQRAVLPVAGAMESLNALFSTEAGALVLARGLGFAALDALNPFKDAIVRAATRGTFAS